MTKIIIFAIINKLSLLHVKLKTKIMNEKFQLGVVILTGLYELVSRVVPTSKKWSIVGLIVDAVKYVSDKLDNIKK